ncbi:MAG: hypothetical protein JJ863_38190 [Deltaproteobacteria bacterium]|nr:hypothetical protein [Deltaproteobacteria bacterium]
MLTTEWLLDVTRRRNGFAELVQTEGGLAPAAWRLAEARCRTSHVSTAVPSRTEVRAAARQLAERLGLSVPSSGTLAADCERRGLLVI